MQLSPVIFNDVFDKLNSFLAEKNYSKIFIFVDSNTHEHCLPLFLGELETINEIEVIEVPPGEENKDIEIVCQVWESLTELGASRNSLLINLGGGVITDMGGFIASTFKRGIDFVNVPTTLLSQVDASVGGKTGIDFAGLKNQIGTFSQPQMTLIFSEFLLTLPPRELTSGLAEMMKHGLIYQKSHWENIHQIEGFTDEILHQLTKESIEIKMKIVEKDPYESGFRKTLNFGHTIGHAVESYYLETEFPYLHGEAVAIGMLVESILSFENEMISLAELDEIFFNIHQLFAKEPIKEEIILDLLELMRHDKKNKNNQISFSLLDGIGNCKYDILLNENQISEGILLYNKKLASL